MKIISRSQWTPVVPKIVTGAEDFTGTPYFRNLEVKGISLFTPDSSAVYVEINPQSIFNSERVQAFTQKGFGDIPYNLGVAGNVDGVFCLRGLCNKSAAHSNIPMNSTHVAVLVLVGKEEPPTDLLLNNLLSCRELVLARWPQATEVNGSTWDIWDNKLPKTSSQFHCTLPEPFSYSSEIGNVLVFELIEFLAYYGYYKARNDGIYGPICHNSVAELQNDLLDGEYYRKRVDGIYGRYTREAACNWLRSLQ